MIPNQICRPNPFSTKHLYFSKSIDTNRFLNIFVRIFGVSVQVRDKVRRFGTILLCVSVFRNSELCTRTSLSLHFHSFLKRFNFFKFGSNFRCFSTIRFESVRFGSEFRCFGAIRKVCRSISIFSRVLQTFGNKYFFAPQTLSQSYLFDVFLIGDEQNSNKSFKLGMFKHK